MNLTENSTDVDSTIVVFIPQRAPLEATLLSIATALTVLGNLGTLAAFAVDPSLRQKPSNFFIVSLCGADFLMGLVVLPLRALETALGYWPLGEATCMVETFFADIALTVAIYSVTAISVDRFLMVSKDYSRYLVLQSRLVVSRTILAIWGVVILSAVLEMILWSTDALEVSLIINFDYVCLSPIKLNQAFLTCIFITGFFIPLGIIVFCSVGFMYYLRRRLRGKIHTDGNFSATEASGSGVSTVPRRTAQTSVTSAPPRVSVATGLETAAAVDPKRNTLTVQDCASTTSTAGATSEKTRGTRGKATMRNRYIKPGITMAALLVVFIACTLPYLIIAAVIAPICPDCHSYSTRVHVANLMFANSCINPFLYAATQSKIRKFYSRHIFPCFFKRRT